MKRLITTLTMFAVMAVMIPFLSTTASAQTRYRTRSYETTTYKRPSFYRRHRNLINIGIATGAGALLGGLIGGKKGALIGTAAGAGGGALYTYKIRPKQPRYYYNY
jgi:outer membrane lipoprotein SlyB